MLDIIKYTLIFFFFLTFKSYSFADSYTGKYSSVYFNNRIENICKGTDQIIDNKYPKKINIRIQRPDQWYKNTAEIIREKSNNRYVKINSNLKKYFKATVEVIFENKATCKFKGKVRLHGGRFDHFQNEHFFSLRVKLEDGHILNNNTFTFYLPEARNGDDEIFLTNLLKEIEILSPDTSYVDLSVNEFPAKKYIFQERHTIPFLVKNNLIPSSIISGNRKYNFEKLQNKKFFTARIDGGSKNLDLDKSYGINHPNRDKIFLDSLSKINYVFYRTFVDYNLDNLQYYINFGDKNFSDIIDSEKISIFDSLLIATGGGDSGLEADDRRFYYDPVYDKIIPIYYDGMPSILRGYSLEEDSQITTRYSALLNFEYLKEGSKKAIVLLNNINLASLQKKLSKSGLLISDEELNVSLKKIKSNLVSLINFKTYEKPTLPQDYPPKFTEDVKFVYNQGLNYNNLEACEPLLIKCEKVSFKSNEINHLLKNQLLKKDGVNYIYFGSQFFKESFKPNVAGLNKLKKIKLENFDIFHDLEKNEITINKNTKKIEFKNILKNQNIILKGKIEGWSFELTGTNRVKENANSLFGSCITIIDSNLKMVNFNLKDTNCLDSIKFIRAKGEINEIKINNATGDGLAGDFSDIMLEKVYVENSKDDCLNFKKGNYYINNLIIKNCQDRGISSGLSANVKVKKLISDTSSISVYAKDSASVDLDSALIKNPKYCYVAYRTLNTYGGGNIITNSKDFDCVKKTFFLSKDSKLIRK